MRRAARAFVTIVGLGLGLGAAACAGPRWRPISPRPGAVYRYDAPIERYAPDDAGLWLVTARDATPEGRRRLAAALDDPDDTSGDGFVVWATDARAAWLREHPAVGAVAPVQPGDRIAAAVRAAVGPVAVEIELADGAGDAQRDAIVAWLGARGVAAAVVGPRVLAAVLTAGGARELAALGPVRWIAPRDAMR